MPTGVDLFLLSLTFLFFTLNVIPTLCRDLLFTIIL